MAGKELANCLAFNSDPSSNADISANLFYIAGGTVVTIPKSVKQSIPGCPLTYTYEYFNVAVNSYFTLSTLTTYN